jgi:hypothetical protein
MPDPADPTAARRAELQAEYSDRLTPQQIDAVLADEALFRKFGAAVGAMLSDNGEIPFVPLLPPEAP